MTATVRAASYGGGIQSTSMLVLAARGAINFPTFVFSNVGDDSEDPDTLTYVEHVARPYAAHHGIEFVTVQRVPKKGAHQGEVETLYGRLTRDGSRSLPIPVRMSNGAPGTRSCTFDFKIVPIGDFLQSRGACESNPAVVGIGISLDEIHRVNARKAMPYEVPTYPLLDHTPPLRRADCEGIILAEALPQHMVEPLRAVLHLLPAITRRDLVASGFTRMPRPPKSACWFCPLHQLATWGTMRRDRPAMFDRAAKLETLLNERRDMLGKDHVFLTRRGEPLEAAIRAAQDELPIDDDDSECDNGVCFV